MHILYPVVVAFLLAILPMTSFAAALPFSSARLTVVRHTYGVPITCTLAAVADAYVAKELAGSNFGTATTLLVNSAAIVGRRSFVRFDLTACPTPIPTGAIVTVAKLRLVTAAIALGTRTYQASRVTAGWTETGVTWTNQPAVAGTASASTSIAAGTASGTTLEWSVIGDVQSFITGTNSELGWRVADSAEGAVVGTLLTLNAREASANRPQLVVTYVP